MFLEVQKGSALFGVVPFENSTNGIVALTLSLFADGNAELFPNVEVCAERYLDVHHYLLGVGDPPDGDSHNGIAREKDQSISSEPVADLSRIKDVYSHPQVWSQCGKFLSSYLNDIPRHDVSSTAEAARLVANMDSKSCAAIASLSAGVACKLQVLAAKIEDNTNNRTRFLILRRREGPKEDSSFSWYLKKNLADRPYLFEHSTWKTLATFTTDPDSPEKLTTALSVFQEYGVRLNNVMSTPSGRQPWHYTYFIEIIETVENEDEKRVQEALGKVKDLTANCRWHGTFEV